MRDDHFTFIGYREYDILVEDGEDVLRAVAGSGLGILRSTDERPISLSFAQLPPEARRLARGRNPLNLTKANSRATVHRPAYLDYVGVKRFDADGEVVGERRFLGLYTHTAYSASPWEIPVLRRKAQRVVERSGLLRGSHDHKALVEILETYPRDELFQISEDELFETALGILHLGERRRVRLFVRRDAFGRFFSCLVYLPRERFDTRNRQRMQEILQAAFGGTSVDYTTRVSESVLARLHVVVYTEPGAVPEYDVAEIEARLAEATRAWTDDLRDALSEQVGEQRAGPLFERYGEAFPGAYREDFSARQAVPDIERIERLDPDGDLGMSLYVPLESTLDHLAFKLVRSGKPILLSDVLPLLENMGVRVSDERPYEIKPADGPPVWIYDFGLRHDEGAEFQADDVREMFQDAFARAWRGESENDGFNRLVLSARLTAREITILRAIAKYLRQAGSTFSQTYMEDALSAHPDVARGVVELFRLRLDPARSEDTDAKARALERKLEGAIDAVESLDEDRILRGFLRVVRAVLRTNYFQTDAARPGQAVPVAQARSRPRSRPARAAADVRGLRLLAARGGRAPARRQGRPRRHPLVRPARGLPHRGARADEGADGQERRHRPGRRQGRLRRQAAPGRRRSRRAARGGRRVLPDVHARPARRDRHDHGRQGRAAARRRPPRRGRPVPRRRRRQGHGDLLGHRERDRDRVRLLARRRVRFGRVGRLRPQADGDHRPGRLGVGQAPLPRARDRHRDHRLHRCRNRRHVRRRVRQRDAALPPHPADRRVRPPPRLPRPESGRGGELQPSASGSSGCRARPGPTTTRR